MSELRYTGINNTWPILNGGECSVCGTQNPPLKQYKSVEGSRRYWIWDSCLDSGEPVKVKKK